MDACLQVSQSLTQGSRANLWQNGSQCQSLGICRTKNFVQFEYGKRMVLRLKNLKLLGRVG